MTAQPRKLIDILNLSSQYLKDRQIESPRLNAELLISHVLELSRVDLYVNFEKPLSDDELQQIRTFLRRRADHEPIQYILGETEFFGLRFELNRATLIPRPETELLVEKLIETLPGNDPVSILDVGTGSGIIAISLAKKLEHASISAIDIRQDAVEIASRNAELHQVSNRMKLQVMDLLSDSDIEKLGGPFDCVVCNPPYITTADMETLPDDVRKYEPKVALEAGSDALRYYRRLAELSGGLLQPNGILGVEIGMNMGEAVCGVFASYSLSIIKTYNDLNGIERVVIASKNSV